METQKLKPLDEYSKPVRRNESTGTTTNDLGQTLAIKVSGEDPGLVEEYMKTVKISFVVLSEEENASVWDEPPEERNDKAQSYPQEELKGLDLHPELGLEIELDVTETNGLEPPYDLNVEIDPTIASGQPHSYITKKKCRKEKVTLKATVNGVYGALRGPSSWRDGQADVLSSTSASSTAKMTAEEASDSNFTLTVTGLRANNTYTVSASMKLVRQ